MENRFGYVKVLRYPFGESFYQTSTARVELGRIIIELLDDGRAWESVSANRWYECSVFDARDREIAHYINPNAPERDSKRPPRSMEAA